MITSEVDCQAWEWIDALGVAHAFTVDNGIVSGQSQGTGMPPVRRADVRVPGRAGAFNLDRSYGERTWALGVTIDSGDGATATTLEEAIEAWAGRFNVLAGPGRIRRTRADGVTKRVLFCDYDAGFGIEQDRGIWAQGSQPAVLTFFAADPFWYDDAATVVPFTTGTGVGFFPIPNPLTGSFITLNASEVYGSATVNNDGQVAVFPTWTITGPGSAISLRNITTGETLALTAAGSLDLAAGEVLTIVTRPGETVLELADGTNVARYLTDPSALWLLERGDNLVQVQMTGATAESAVSMSYTRGWLTS